MPVFPGPRLDALCVEYSGYSMDTVAVTNIEVKDFSDNDRFFLANGKVFLFVALLIEPSAPYECIAVWGVAALVF